MNALNKLVNNYIIMFCK